MCNGKDGYDALKLAGSLKPDIVLMGNHLEYIEGQEIPPLLKLRSPLTAVVLLAAGINDHQLFRAVVNEVSGFASIKTDLLILPELLKCVSEGGCFICPGLAARILHLISEANRKGFDIQGHYFSNSPAIVSQKHFMEAKFPACEDPVSFLSKAELQILTYIGEGYTSLEIADELQFAIGTVRNYISAMMHKIGLQNRSQMVRYAMDYGLIKRS